MRFYVQLWLQLHFNSFPDAYHAPDEVTAYRTQYYLLYVT